MKQKKPQHKRSQLRVDILDKELGQKLITEAQHRAGKRLEQAFERERYMPGLSSLSAAKPVDGGSQFNANDHWGGH
jgi:hypothetical protein